jgi:hypothetical protein
MGQTTMSLLNHDNNKNAGHHHISITIGIYPSEDH